MTRQARSEHTRSQLLRAAATLLRGAGYVGTNMAEISHAAGITKGGLYFHFSSKDDVCRHVQEAAIELLRDTANSPRLGQRSAIQRLVDLTHQLARWRTAEPVVGASVRMARELGAQDEQYLAFSHAWFEQVYSCLDEAERTGELSADVPAETVALLVAVMVDSAEVGESTLVLHRRDAAEGLADMWSLILPGIVGAHAAELDPHGLAPVTSSPSDRAG